MTKRQQSAKWKRDSAEPRAPKISLTTKSRRQRFVCFVKLEDQICLKHSCQQLFEEMRDGGSMDSDKFQKIMKQRERIRENEEAIEKFVSYRSLTQNILNEVSNMFRHFKLLSHITVSCEQDSSIEKIMRVLIDRMHIRNVAWIKVNNGNSYQISFTLEKGIRTDDTIHMLWVTFFRKFSPGLKNIFCLSSKSRMENWPKRRIVSRHCSLCTLQRSYSSVQNNGRWSRIDGHFESIVDKRNGMEQVHRDSSSQNECR